MASLADFVFQLTTDAAQAQKFTSSTDAAKQSMAAAGLSDEQQQILLSCDSDKITQAITDELGKARIAGIYTECELTLMLKLQLPKQS